MTERKKFKCPGKDLEDLVKIVNEVIFFEAFKKPDKSKVEARLKRLGEPVLDYPDNLQDETDREFNQATEKYHSHRGKREKFIVYFGVNPEEIGVEDFDSLEGVRLQACSILRKHAENHAVCLQEYFRFLDKETDRNAKLFAGAGKNYDKELMIKNLDEMYLGLMNI